MLHSQKRRVCEDISVLTQSSGAAAHTFSPGWGRGREQLMCTIAQFSSKDVFPRHRRRYRHAARLPA